MLRLDAIALKAAVPITGESTVKRPASPRIPGASLSRVRPVGAIKASAGNLLGSLAARIIAYAPVMEFATRTVGFPITCATKSEIRLIYIRALYFTAGRSDNPNPSRSTV